MSKRPGIARNAERALWAEAIGHCMNPDCQIELIKDEVSIGEMAHIKAHSDGGDVSCNNLLLLCGNCHTQIDGNRTEATITQLQQWKRNRNSEIQRQFAKLYTSFMALEEDAVPLLSRNAIIFYNYGPANDEPHSEERHKMWLRFEPEIISNNRKLQLMLERNKNLFHKANRPLVDQFIAHAHEFAATRDDNPIKRILLFPEDFLSIFGMGPADNRYLVSNLSALQNLIADLMRKDKFLELDLEVTKTLVFQENNKETVLDLLDWPHVNQVYYRGRYYQPETTKVRLESLIFFLEWLSNNNINYVFDDFRNLTELTLNRRHRVKLCYAYCLSLSDLHEIQLEDGLIVVNLHNWNGAPVSSDAHKHASHVNVRLFSQNDFFIFAHKNIK